MLIPTVIAGLGILCIVLLNIMFAVSCNGPLNRLSSLSDENLINLPRRELLSQRQLLTSQLNALNTTGGFSVILFVAPFLEKKTQGQLDRVEMTIGDQIAREGSRLIEGARTYTDAGFVAMN